MLVEAGSGKSGVAFNVVLEKPEGDFVLIDNNGSDHPTSPQPPARLQKAVVRELSPSDVVKKIQLAEARRASEVSKVRGAARAHNKKVTSVVAGVERQQANKYWELDSKLRAADRRREELVSQVRAKAQEHSARVGAVNKANETKVKSLDSAINVCLLRAAENRKTTLAQIRERIAVQNAKKEYTRKTVASEGARASMDTFWSLDRKLQEADRRRRAALAEIREKAKSPSSKAAMIRDQQAKEAELTAERITEKLTVAAARNEEAVNTVKAKAHDHVQKVEAVTEQVVRRKSTRDEHATLKLLRAEEKRARQLDEVRRQQRERALKAERVRHAKRAIEAQQK